MRAIDVHAYPPGPGGRPATSDPKVQSYFPSVITHGTAEEMAEYYAQVDSLT